MKTNLFPPRAHLFMGDCLDIMKSLKSHSVGMILCDLPYGTSACKWDSIIPFPELWEQYERVIKQDGAVVLFGSEPFSSLLRTSNLAMYKYDWKWENLQEQISLTLSTNLLKFMKILWSLGKVLHLILKRGI